MDAADPPTRDELLATCQSYPLIDPAITVSSARELASALSSATAGDVIALAAGTYDLDYLAVDVDGVELVGVDRDQVVIDAPNTALDVTAGDVVIANLTFTSRVATVSGAADGDRANVLFYNVAASDVAPAIRVDGYNQFHSNVLGNPISDDGIVACSLLTQTSTPSCGSGARGVTLNFASGWRITRNRFTGVRCSDATAPVVQALNGSDVTIDNNTFRDVDLAIRVGSNADIVNPECDGNDGYAGGLVCNNAMSATSARAEGGALRTIEACGMVVAHNSVYMPGVDEAFQALRESELTAANNLSNAPLGPAGAPYDPGFATSNQTDATPSHFVDVGAGDLRPATGVSTGVDVSSVELGVCAIDMIGATRTVTAPAHVGAYE